MRSRLMGQDPQVPEPVGPRQRSRTIRSPRFLVTALFVILGTPVSYGCGDDGPTDTTPDGAFKLFLESLQRYDRGRALELLAPESRRELENRARRATRQAGREIEPERMLAVERFVMRWEIDRIEAEVDGDSAVVSVFGKDESQRAEVALRRVGSGVWRVVLPL